MKAIILAAGRGTRMGNITDEHPKCLTKIFNKPLIEHQINALNQAGITDIGIVTGYKSECLQEYGSHHFYNANWDKTNMVVSMLCAKEWLYNYDCIISYSDIFYGPEVILDLIDCDGNVAISYDSEWLKLWEKRFSDPLEDAETFVLDQTGFLSEIGSKPKTVEEIEGQYMGLLKFRKLFWKNWDNDLQLADTIDMTSFLSLLIKSGIKINTVMNKSKWGEVDTPLDIRVY